MTLGKLITRLLRPCSSAPKSPTPPNSPNSDGTAAEQARKDLQIVEATPCTDISKGIPSDADSGSEKDPAKTSQDKATAEIVHQPGVPVEAPVLPGSVSTVRSTPATEPVPDASEKLIREVFGFDILHQLQGKTWDERGQAVQAVRARVVQEDVGSASLEDFFHAGCAVAFIGLKDKVMPVFFDGLDVAKLLLGEFAGKHTEALAAPTVKEEVDNLVPVIVAKTSDRNARSIEGTRQAIVFLARQPTVGCQQVVSHILTQISNTKEVAAIRGRLELVGHMIDEFGFGKGSSLSLSTVMGFVRPHLDAADEKVRRAAVEVTVSCYSLKGERTMKYCSNLKPALLKLLEQRFAELDSKNGGGKKSAVGSLPEVRGAKVRKSKQRKNTPGSSASSRQSSSGSVYGKPLAPLEMSPGGRMPHSREGAILEDKVTVVPQADIFAPVYHDVLRSPGDLPDLGSQTLSTPNRASEMGVNVNPVAIPNHEEVFAVHEDPNFIPSPTAAVTSESFDEKIHELDEAFMDEIINS